MARVQAPIRFTYQDYKGLPASETQHYELLEGELIMIPSPSFGHQLVLGNLWEALRIFVREHDLGIVLSAPFDVVLGKAGEERVVQPDIFYVSHKRAAVIHEEEIRGAPDLVVEVLSASTAQRDRTYKRTLYARSGVREYWLVDAETEQIEVLTLEKKGYRQAGLYQRGQVLESPLLEGLKIALDEVF